MKKTAITALILGIASTVSAATLLTNDFTDGATTGWTDNGNPTTLTISDDTSGIGDGNAMKYATTGKNNQWAELDLGQTVTLAVDDSISLSMDVRFTGDRNSPPDQNNSIRWMFMTTDDVMTGVGVNTGSDSSLSSWAQIGTTRQGGKFDGVNLGTTAHSVNLTLTRKDDGSGSYLEISYTQDGGAAIVRESAVIASPTTEFSFDAIMLGSSAIDDGSGTQGFDGVLYDNIIIATSGATTQPPALELDAGSQSFTLDQGETAALPLLINNTGFEGTNITVSLSTTSSWLSVLTSPISTATLTGNSSMTNTFSVSIDGNTPDGDYPDILSLEMVAYSTEGAAITSTAPISLTILSTNFPTLIVNGSAQTFTDGTVAGWAPDAPGIFVAVTNDSGGIGTGNALLITSSSSNRRVTTPLSESVTLSLTNSITLNMDYRFLYGPSNVNQSLEFRFTDSTSGNYAGITMNPASSASQTLVFQRDGDTNEGKVNSFDHGTDTQSMTLTVTHVVDASTSTEAQIDVAWAGNPAGPYTGGGTSTVTDPTHTFTFDTLSVGIVGGTTTDGLLLDNIIVSSTEIGVPPPPDPVLEKIGLNMLSGTSYVLTWTSENGVSYEVKTTTNLVTGAWVPAITNIDGNGGSLSVTGTTTEATSFYRVFVEE